MTASSKAATKYFLSELQTKLTDNIKLKFGK